MKKTILALVILLSSSAYALSAAQLDKLFNQRGSPKGIDDVIHYISSNIGEDIAEDLSQFIYDDQGTPQYIVGVRYACKLVLKSEYGELVPYGASSCVTLKRK